MAQRFNRQVVVVTGASSGIGRATAYAFTREGARVVLGARRKEQLEVAAAAMRHGGREARAIPCNVVVPQQVQRLIDAAIERWDRIDVLVANAGVGLTGEIAETDREDMRHVFDTNVIGAEKVEEIVNGKTGQWFPVNLPPNRDDMPITPHA